MKIDVFGAVFLDMYLYGERFKSEIIESIGGSGLNVAFGLHLLGNDVYFHGNIGDDDRKSYIFNILDKYKFPKENILVEKGKTGLFIAKDDNVISMERGVNELRLGFDVSNIHGEYAFLTTELDKESIERILSLNWKKIFIDVGPRPFILKDIKLPENVIKIGNKDETDIIDCDIIKLGPSGAKWDEVFIEGDKKIYPYTIGAGDLFDSILIDSLTKGKSKEESLEKAVKYSEISCSIKGGCKILNIIKNCDFNHRI